MDWRIILKCMSKKQSVSAWTTFIWLRVGTGGALLWKWCCCIVDGYYYCSVVDRHCFFPFCIIAVCTVCKS
jgi:hypothetical protein